MHIILGAGGPVANQLTRQFIANSEPVRLVSRKPVAAFPALAWQRADLKNIGEVKQAVQGATVIYLCAGLTYDKKVWAVEWPLIMNNLIDAARSTGARIIFFDNVYMYGRVQGAMTEETPYHPESVKGEIRAGIARRLMEESSKGNIDATIARAADFYGAETMKSFFDMMVLAKYAKGQKAMYLGDAARKHCFTYVPDAGRAMYLLGHRAQSGNQVWHMPTAPAMTGQAFIELAADVFGQQPKFMGVNKLMLQALGLFNREIGETAEMYYQYRYDYVFDSTKFERAFAVTPTGYREGLVELSKTVFAQ